MIKLMIFDLDGTLLNSLDDLADSTNHILAKHSLPTHPLDSFRYFVGNGQRKLVERALPAEKRTPEYIEDFFRELVAYYGLHSQDKTRPYPCVIECLEQLQEKGVGIAVASNKVNAVMQKMMPHYFPMIHFACLLGQREGIPAKPHPQIIFDIMEQVKVAKEEVLYVGDTGVDMDTAHNAGLRAAGVLWGYRDRQELEEHGAEFIIDKPADLLNLL